MHRKKAHSRHFCIYARIVKSIIQVAVSSGSYLLTTQAAVRFMQASYTRLRSKAGGGWGGGGRNYMESLQVVAFSDVNWTSWTSC